MSTNFPVALDSLTNPLGSDSMAVVSHAAQHTDANDAIEALQVRVGITGSTDPASLTYRVSADGEGAAIAALTAKTTPVDADLVGLSDSAAGGVLKKLSWSSIKAALQSVFATLAGIAGGQTLNGGTGASETLTLRSTAHATKGKILFGTSAYDEANNDLGLGTTNPSARIHVVDTTEQERLGYDLTNYLSTTISSLGKATWSATSGTYAVVGPTNAQATATLGSELVTNSLFTTDLSSWTAGANWAWVSGGAKHTAGSTATLSQNVTVTSGSTYQVSVVISGRTAGSVAFALGAVNVIWGATSTTASASGDRTVIAGASGSVAFTITPTTDFDGSIDSLSIKSVSLGTFPVVFSFTEEGNNAVDIRVSRARYNLSFGRDSGRSITSGNYNTNFGSGTGRSITTGIYNLNFGSDAGYSITTGNSNCNFGVNAGYYLTSGSYNNVFGAFTGENIGTGSNNNLIGNAAGRGYANCSNNVCIGSDAGRLASDGTTTVTTASNCTYVGTATKASGVTVSSEIAIGYQAIGLGSNTTVIGTTSTTKTKMFGTPIFTPATSATPTVNGELLIEATSNTSVTIKLKGTDGVVRSAVLTLA